MLFVAIVFSVLGVCAGYISGRYAERRTWMDSLERLEKASRFGFVLED